MVCLPLQVLALQKDQPIGGLGVRTWRETAGRGIQHQEGQVSQEASSLKCFKGLQTASVFFFKTERNLVRNQSTHMLITYSMTKKKPNPHKFLQPLGSQCLLPLINFLELSVSGYFKTWPICQPQEALPAPAVGVGGWWFWNLCHPGAEGSTGAHSKLRELQHQAPQF